MSFSSHPSASQDPLWLQLRADRRRAARHRKLARRRALHSSTNTDPVYVPPSEPVASEDTGSNPYFQPRLLELGPSTVGQDTEVDWDQFRTESSELPQSSPEEREVIGGRNQPEQAATGDGLFFKTRRPMDSVLRMEYDKGLDYVNYCTPSHTNSKYNIINPARGSLQVASTLAECKRASNYIAPLIEHWKFCTFDTESYLSIFNYETDEEEYGELSLLLVGAPPHEVVVYNLTALKKIKPQPTIGQVLGRVKDLLARPEVTVLGIAIHKDIEKMPFITSCADIRGQFYTDICSRLVTSPNNIGMPKTGMKHLAFTVLGTTHACYYVVKPTSKYFNKFSNKLRKHRELYGEDLDPDNMPAHRNMKDLYDWTPQLSFRQKWYLYLDGVTPIVYVLKHAMRKLEEADTLRLNLTLEGATAKTITMIKKARPPPGLSPYDPYLIAYHRERRGELEGEAGGQPTVSTSSLSLSEMGESEHRENFGTFHFTGCGSS